MSDTEVEELQAEDSIAAGRPSGQQIRDSLILQGRVIDDESPSVFKQPKKSTLGKKKKRRKKRFNARKDLKREKIALERKNLRMKMEKLALEREKLYLKKEENETSAKSIHVTATV